MVVREGDSAVAEVDAKEVGQRLARARQDAGMTQKELGNLVGVTQRSVANWESGRVVPYRHLPVIEAAVGRPAASLLYSDDGTRRSGVLGHRNGARDFLEGLERLVELRYQEMISEEEFAAAKALLLGLDAKKRSLRAVPDEHASPRHAAE